MRIPQVLHYEMATNRSRIVVVRGTVPPQNF